MTQQKLLLYLTPVIIALISYILLNNVYISIAIFVIYLLYFVLRLNIFIARFDKQKKKIEFLYTFMNDLIISISVYKNVEKACESTLEQLQFEKNKTFGDLSSFNAYEKVKYLSNYFLMPIYDIFLNVLDAYIENGGDILEMCEFISTYISQIEGYFIKSETVRKNKLIEFIGLWIFCLLLLFFIRFALADFYAQLSSSVFYLIGLVFFFLFVIISIEVLLFKLCKNKIQGVNLCA